MSISTILIIIGAVILGVLLCASLSIANFSYESFYYKYLDLDKEATSSGLSTMGFFQLINKSYFNGKITIYNSDSEEIGVGAYAKGVLFLPSTTIESNSLASFAIIAHELGHAKQDFFSNKLKVMNRLRKIGRIIGKFMFPLLLCGLILLIVGGSVFYYGVGLLSAGIMIFLLAIILKARTIVIEKDASQNALVYLNEVLNGKEVKECKKFLNSAKLTYWGDMFRTFLGWTRLTRKTKMFR